VRNFRDELCSLRQQRIHHRHNGELGVPAFSQAAAYRSTPREASEKSMGHRTDGREVTMASITLTGSPTTRTSRRGIESGPA
jgi:hypothetical protein